MPIEFSCSECQSVLRTPDATAGKVARCPKCGSFENIPFPDGDSTTNPASAPQAESQFDEQVLPDPEPDPKPSQNPYAVQASPYSQSTTDRPPWSINPPSRQVIRGRLLAPAITVLVFACLSILFVGLATVGGVISLFEGGAPQEDIFGLIFCGAVILCNGIGVLGCIAMLQMRYHVFCIIAMICVILGSVCCCFATSGFGIWGLIVLLQPEVKDCFD